MTCKHVESSVLKHNEKSFINAVYEYGMII